MADELAQFQEFPLWVYKLAIPKTSLLSFEGMIKGVDAESSKQLKEVDKLREIMRTSLESDSPQNCINAVEHYLANLYGMVKAQERLPPEAAKFIQVWWTTVIGTRFTSYMFSSTSLRWELIMCLQTMAFSMRNHAHQALNEALKGGSPEIFENKSKESASYLSKAAGIFEYIGTVEISNWLSKPETLLPEFSPDFYVACSSLCLAESAAISVKKGAQKQMSFALLSKVASDVASKFEHSLVHFKQVKPQNEILPPLLNYLECSARLWKSIALALTGINYYTSKDFGHAAAYLAEASKLEEKRDSMLEMFLALYNTERKVIQQISEAYRQENDTVYFADTNVAVSAPEAKGVTKSTAFQPPVEKPINIVVVGSQCNVM